MQNETIISLAQLAITIAALAAAAVLGAATAWIWGVGPTWAFSLLAVTMVLVLMVRAHLTGEARMF